MTDIFNHETTTPEETDEEVYARMKNKYGDDLKIAKAKDHSDRHILQLERETARMREELTKQKTMEEFLLEIKKGTATPPSNPPQDDEQGYERQSPAFKPEDLEAIAERKAQDIFNRKEQETRAKNNVSFVHQELTKAWGDNYSQKLSEAPKNLGVSQEWLAKMAEDNPQVFLKLVVGQPSPNRSPDNVAPPKGSGGFQGSTSNVRNWKYYEKLRREDPENYWSRSVQMAITKDAFELGDDFYK